MLKSFFIKNQIEAGIDEAGRGCLAGPVVAAAVILPANYKNTLLNDSKKLSEKNRKICLEQIKQHAIAYSIGVIDHKIIDKINILQATFKAMHLAIDGLDVNPTSLIIDGNRFLPYASIPYNCIVKGDGKYMSIAAASILAKCFRDELMENLHFKYPIYNWDKNKGYPTLHHRTIVLKHGFSPFHRKTFHVQVDPQLELF